MCWPIPASRLLDKLATLPLGTVLDRSSGSYKNIIVERVDSIETTLAHLLPEMTTNIVGALAVLVLLFIEGLAHGPFHVHRPAAGHSLLYVHVQRL